MRQLEGAWRLFMDGGVSYTPPNDILVSFIMNRCDQECIPYTLTAYPGREYHIKPKENDDVQAQPPANG